MVIQVAALCVMAFLGINTQLVASVTYNVGRPGIYTDMECSVVNVSLVCEKLARMSLLIR